MKDAQKPGHLSLNTLITRLREGRYVIPDFQREFEWEPWDVNALLRSVFLDYYIGSLLLWKGKPETFKALACEPIHGFYGEGDPHHIVLDGQQRLTALYYACMAPNMSAPRRKNRFLFFIRVDKFMQEAYDEAFVYDWTRRGEKLVGDRESQFASHMFPLAIIGDEGWSLPNWVQGYEQHWREAAESAQQPGDQGFAEEAEICAINAASFGDYLRDLTQEYQVAFIELDCDLEIDKVCDIFTQINSRGIRLDAFDLINALLKPKDIQLKHLWREAAPRLSFVDTERMNVYVLQVMSILRQAYCSPKYLYYLLPGQERKVRGQDGALRKEVLIQDIGEFEYGWNSAVNAMERAIEMLRDPRGFGAISSQFLPYISILPAFAALQAEARSVPPSRQLDAQRKVRFWYWASVFTNRYSGSVESTAARDYLDVKAWFGDDSAEPSLIAEFRDRFRSLDLRRETKRGTSVYNGVFDLLVLRGAQDWATGTAPRYNDLDDHHIVPQSSGKALGLGTKVDSILNRTPLTRETNRNLIKERLPNEYLPESFAASGEARVRATLDTHFISPAAVAVLLRDPFTADDFEEFVTERQRTIQQGIEDLLVKERLDLPPQLRELDSRVEEIELELRRMIDAALEGDSAKVPDHLSQKIEERLQRAVRKDPAFDEIRYGELAGKLEYADLRELESLLVNRSLWPLFQGRFGQKELLAKRFGQLAELRNGIRHSRTIDEVTRKEGEAAILWFRQLLSQWVEPQSAGGKPTPSQNPGW